MTKRHQCLVGLAAIAWMLCLFLVAAWSAAPGPSGDTWPPLVVPPEAGRDIIIGTNILQWIILLAAMLGALSKRLNDQTVDASWSAMRTTVFQVVVTGAATYVLLDVAMAAGFLDRWLYGVMQHPLTAGAISFLGAALAGGGIVAAMETIMNHVVGLLTKADRFLGGRSDR